MRKARALEALADQRAASVALFDGLAEPLWSRRSRSTIQGVGTPPPERSVCQVAAHLVAADARLTARALLAAAAGRLRGPGPSPARVVPGDEAALTARGPAELSALLAAHGARVRRLLRRLPGPVVGLPGPVVTARRRGAGGVIASRVLHEWVHADDVAAAVAAPSTTPTAAVADALAAGVLESLPPSVLPHARRTVGVMRLVVDREPAVEAATAPEGRVTFGVDFARRQYGSRVTATPQAVVRTSAPALARVAYTRVAWRSAAAGCTVEGDADLAAELLDLVARYAREPA